MHESEFENVTPQPLVVSTCALIFFATLNKSSDCSEPNTTFLSKNQHIEVVR